MIIFFLAVPSPTNSLHIIREENQQHRFLSSSSQNKSSSSSSSSEGLYDIDDDENEMDCEVNHYHHHQVPQRQQFIRPSIPFYRAPYHHRAPPPYYCNSSPLLAQRLTIPTTATSSYTP